MSKKAECVSNMCDKWAPLSRLTHDKEIQRCYYMKVLGSKLDLTINDLDFFLKFGAKI